MRGSGRHRVRREDSEANCSPSGRRRGPEAGGRRPGGARGPGLARPSRTLQPHAASSSPCQTGDLRGAVQPAGGPSGPGGSGD